MLSKSGVNLDEESLTVLDFGCGCGRLSRHLVKFEQITLWGCDINPRLVNWCKEHIPSAQFFRNDRRPPIKLAADTISLILARSIFTHLEADMQDEWLKEFARVLQPGGWLWITLSGDHYTQQMSHHESKDYQHGKMVIRKGTLQGSNDCAVFHPPSYAQSLFEQHGFAVRQFISGNTVRHALQDSYLCQKMEPSCSNNSRDRAQN